MGERETDRRYIWVLVLLALPFYLNDLSNILIRNWRWWLLVDYVGVKLFPCLVVWRVIRTGKMPAAAFGLTSQKVLPFLGVFLIVALTGTLIDQNGYGLVADFPGYGPLGGMPELTSDFWHWTDLTLGLLMVGIVEELVFRGYLDTFIRRYTRRPGAIVGISAVAFGLIHWSNGLHAVLITAVVGAVFMKAYQRTRSLPAIMLAHFMVNFIDFAGVIPRSIFRLI